MTTVPCSLWCSPPDPEEPEAVQPGWCCPVDLTVEGVYDKAVWAATVASAVLFRLSGYRFTGACAADEYLCVRMGPCGCPMLGCGADWRSYPVPVGDAEQWINVQCGCGQGCDCMARSRIALPYGPVGTIDEVSLNGEVIPEADYVLVGGRFVYFRSLSREALAAACLNPFTDPVSGLRVKWTFGAAPPPDGVAAACALACELLKACTQQDCLLPKRITSMTRQGVTFALLDPMTFLDNGRTGIYEVDLFIAGYDVPQTTVTFVEDVTPIDFSERARPRW